MSPSHLDTFHRYMDAVHRRDADALIAELHDDVEYRNMPYDRVMRKQDRRKFFEWFGKGMSNHHLTVLNLLCQGDVLVCEGVESYDKNGHHVTLPYTSVIEFKDGKMFRQRDYFDARSIEVQLGLTPPPETSRRAPAA
ncbi:nuclear transport factor 2 family protein [Hydrogenophaga sp. BPS33]|uniref:nuclear transport factor 2 family protein n=1 Tax=Hydrogenophaga sp. BPS33 TaxID=2651974 RepID=UPI00135A5DC2|nr:nuclear transport factor 2 family protein [Hydrogenophaga sp. BPS33]